MTFKCILDLEVCLNVIEQDQAEYMEGQVIDKVSRTKTNTNKDKEDKESNVLELKESKMQKVRRILSRNQKTLATTAARNRSSIVVSAIIFVINELLLTNASTPNMEVKRNVCKV